MRRWTTSFGLFALLISLSACATTKKNRGDSARSYSPWGSDAAGPYDSTDESRTKAAFGRQ